MNDPLKTSGLQTLPDTPSAISSPVSASGAAPCASQDGLTTGPSGQVPAPASLSPRQAKVLGLMTSGTSGPRSTGSLSSAALQSSLESRLRVQTASSGSTLYKLTWKQRGIEQGQPICALRASVRRTSDSECIGWPTPNAGPQNDTDSRWEQRREEVKARYGHGHNGFGMTLGMASTLTGWPTPNTMTGGQTSRGGDRIGEPLMAGAAQLCGWTTTTRDWKDTAGDIKPRADTGKDRFDQLPRQANLAGWRTPTCQSPNSLRGEGQDPEKRLAQGHTVNLTDEVNWLKNNPQPARLTATGEMLTGSFAGMENGGQLNPAHSRWLMGLPIEWDAYAPTVTPSSRKSRKRS